MSRPKIMVYREGDVYRYAHLKRDGIWITLTGDGRALTRHPDGMHDVCYQMGDMPAYERWGDFSEFKDEAYCELYAPGRDATDVKSLLSKGEVTSLRLEAFATPCLSAEAPLDEVSHWCCRRGLEFVPWGDAATGASPDSLFASHADAEGVVFKDGNLLNWAKWKPVLTTDLVVTGAKDGKGRFLGLVGALEMSLADGTRICMVSGMDDQTREEVSDDLDSYIGRVAEIAYQKQLPTGGLRHPRFVRWRDDKSAEECRSV